MSRSRLVVRDLQLWQREALKELFADPCMPRVGFVMSTDALDDTKFDARGQMLSDMYADHDAAVSLCQDFVKAFFAGVSAGAKYTAEQCGQVARAASSSRVACAIPATKRGT